MSGIKELGEFGLIRLLTQGLKTSPQVIAGIGDDCAVTRLGGADLLLSCDALVEGVHFRRAWTSPEAIGWKGAASALSDIAAMGGAARFMLVTLGCPDAGDRAFLEGVYAGIAEAAAAFEVCVVGGDTVSSPAALMLDVFVVGEVVAGRALYRSGALPGDLVAVTGWPGRAALGLKALECGHAAPDDILEAQRRPQPRLREGVFLARAAAVHAMIDVSDGIAQDLGHIAARSGVCITVESQRLPLSTSLAACARVMGVSPVACALTGGEDYELALTLDAAEAASVIDRFTRDFNLPLTVIGEVQDGAPCVLVDGEPVLSGGWDHFRAGK